MYLTTLIFIFRFILYIHRTQIEKSGRNDLTVHQQQCVQVKLKDLFQPECQTFAISAAPVIQQVGLL